MTQPPLIVFSDLDGTLLDHETYDFTPALPALERLKSLGIPVVLSSSKTAEELHALRQTLGLDPYPAIVENGAGVLAAGSTPGSFDRIYHRIRMTLNRLPPELRQHFLGFGDMGPEAISEITGLSPDDARMARNRQYSEPGIWSGSDQERDQMLTLLQIEGVTAREGGRFLTLSLGDTKASQMDRILASFGHPKSLALGDAPNDVEMLRHADSGVIIHNPHREPLPPLPEEKTGRITRTELAGPEGWNVAVNDLLDSLAL